MNLRNKRNFIKFINISKVFSADVFSDSIGLHRVVIVINAHFLYICILMLF